jgi:hypothetical protein
MIDAAVLLLAVTFFALCELLVRGMDSLHGGGR